MDIDKCLTSVGSFGLYQKLLSFVLVSYTTFTCGINYYSQVSGVGREECRDNESDPALPLLSPFIYFKLPASLSCTDSDPAVLHSTV